jgi:uncharacterized protein YcbX
MITVRSLHIYPVKSCRGIGVDHAEVGPTGFRFDRRWMVVGADGTFLSQRSHPVLARVSTAFERNRLVLATADRPPLEVAVDGANDRFRTVTIWKDTCEAVSEGRESAAWFSALLGIPCELVRLPETGIRQVDRNYAGRGDRVAFADGFPFLLISQASVDGLSRKLGTPVPADRFRANIIIDGCDAHAEDGWLMLTIGEIDFRVAKPCARCVVITTDQADGSRTPEPLRTLATYRTENHKVLFGQNLVHNGTGVVRVDDTVHPTPRL